MSAFRGSHLDLCRDLAEHLSTQGYRAWVEVRRVGVQSYGDAGRIDVLALTPWMGRTKFSMIAFEIKTQRSDFLRDVNTGKWRRYVTEYGVPSVCFACLKGVATVEDVPADAGLFIRGDDGWKRSKGPRPLEGDQRKLDPLLLLSLLTDQPYDAIWRRRLERGERLKVPPSVAQAIKNTPDAEYYDLLRYSDLGKLIGHDLSRRLALPPKEIESVHKWAMGVIKCVAEAIGKDPETIREEAIAHGDYSEIQRHVADGLRFHSEREMLHRLLAAATAVGSAYDYQRTQLEAGLRVAEAIDNEEAARLNLQNQKRKRGAA